VRPIHCPFPCLFLAGAVLFAQPVNAEEFSWLFKVYGAALESDGSASTNTTTIGTGTEFINSYSVDLSTGSGFGFSAERFIWNQRLGLEFGALFADVDAEVAVDIRGGSSGDRTAATKVNSDFESLYFGANYHFFKPEKWYDIYAGVFTGLIHYADAVVTVEDGSGRINIDDDIGYGALLGLDAKFGTKNEWRASFTTKYMITETLFSFGFQTADGGVNAAPVNVEVNPWIFQLGIGYSF